MCTLERRFLSTFKRSFYFFKNLKFPPFLLLISRESLWKFGMALFDFGLLWLLWAQFTFLSALNLFLQH